MNHWTIGEGELRRQVGMQAERYRDLRRRSEEVRLIEAALGPRDGLGRGIRSWLEGSWSRVRHALLHRPVSNEGLRHGRG